MSKTLDTYEPQSAEQARITSAVEQYARDFGRDAGVTGASLILCGAPGTGKTHLGCAVANELLKQGFTALYTTATALVRDIRATWARDSERTETEVLKAFIAPDLLIIDEIGVQAGSADEKIRLFDVINSRYEQVKPTLIISNLDVRGVCEYLGERAIDRLRENGGQALAFTWDSYRKNQTQESAQ
jgi:DNA replication protein DnaC